ncbi:uncharacterized protein [Cardiocondyla obscurior]|uniref:uncharacterized protein n=1 Tax=Cardiocondyla obscurior TaxID=286306 RepID=UPI0039655C11
MPNNKFGTLLKDGGGSNTNQHYRYNALARNYVRDNALCVTSTDYDARSRKIKHVAKPLDDDDAVNKQYVQQNLQILKNGIVELNNNVQQNVQNLKDQLNELNKKIEILQSSLQCIKSHSFKNVKENKLRKTTIGKRIAYTGEKKFFSKACHSARQLVLDYNMRKHRTIGMRSVDVTPANAGKLLATVYSRIKIAAPARFKTGDSVRVSKFKTIFEKGYTPNWTTEVFTIVKVQKTNPVTYLLEDSCGKPIAGGFYEQELLHVNNPDVYLVEKVLRKEGNNVYVKWLGFNDSHNSWICKNNVL